MKISTVPPSAFCMPTQPTGRCHDGSQGDGENAGQAFRLGSGTGAHFAVWPLSFPAFWRLQQAYSLLSQPSSKRQTVFQDRMAEAVRSCLGLSA